MYIVMHAHTIYIYIYVYILIYMYYSNLLLVGFHSSLSYYVHMYTNNSPVPKTHKYTCT